MSNKSPFETEQESFWAGEFGDEYSTRNRGASWIASNVAMFARILQRTRNVNSVLELGANIGMNLRAIRHLLPTATLHAVEINETAVKELQRLGDISVQQTSLFDFKPETPADFVLIKGVLIHLNPDRLSDAYDLLHSASQRYICIAEYYNPTPVSVQYRGHNERLFKRDFVSEIRERFPSLKLLDYGFVYRFDPNFPQDDITWFLLEKE